MLKPFFLLIAVLFFVAQSAVGDIFSRQFSSGVARVVIATGTNATIAFQPQAKEVRALVNRGILELTHEKNISNAWRKVVSPKETVGIKVYSSPGTRSGTRPEVVAAVIEGLIAAKIPTNHIVIWDKELADLRIAGFSELAARYNVNIAATASSGYDEKTFYDSPLIGNLIWGDVEFGTKGSDIGRKSFVTRLLTKEISKIISIVPLLNHNVAGTTGHLYSLAFGSVDNTRRFEQSGRLATALPEIYALPAIGDKVVLNITDALICQYQGEQRTLLHYSAPLNEIWFSKDPVALDVLAIQELNRQREIAKTPKIKLSMEPYENAALLELGVSDVKSIQVERTP